MKVLGGGPNCSLFNRARLRSNRSRDLAIQKILSKPLQGSADINAKLFFGVEAAANTAPNRHFSHPRALEQHDYERISGLFSNLTQVYAYQNPWRE